MPRYFTLFFWGNLGLPLTLCRYLKREKERIVEEQVKTESNGDVTETVIL
jgi:hypothetical protein